MDIGSVVKAFVASCKAGATHDETMNSQIQRQLDVSTERSQDCTVI